MKRKWLLDEQCLGLLDLILKDGRSPNTYSHLPITRFVAFTLLKLSESLHLRQGFLCKNQCIVAVNTRQGSFCSPLITFTSSITPLRSKFRQKRVVLGVLILGFKDLKVF
jgi:hypothetical protein